MCLPSRPWRIASLVLASACFTSGSSAQNERVYFGILHSHTSYSDGSGFPEDAYAHARDKGRCDFFAITEHNHNNSIDPKEPRVGKDPIGGNHALYDGETPEGHLSLIEAAKAATKDGVFVALYGQEFSSISSGNHVNVFDVPHVIEAPNGEFDRLVEWINDPSHFDSTGRAAIVQFNHPAIDLRRRHIEYGADDFPSASAWLSSLQPLVCTIEVLNGPGLSKDEPRDVPSSFEDAYMFYLSQGLRIAPTGDQDNHFRTWGTLTSARTGVVIAGTLTKQTVLDAIRARHVYATSDRNLRVIVRVNGSLAGDRLMPPAPNEELDVQIQLDDDDEPGAGYRIECFTGNSGDGRPPTELDRVDATGNGLVKIEDIRFTGPKQYLFFKVTQTNEDGHADHAWTAPVWFDGEAPLPPPDAPDLPADDSQFIASKRSSVYHTNPHCPSALSIKDSNRVTGREAMKGREAHQCPRK